MSTITESKSRLLVYLKVKSLIAGYKSVRFALQGSWAYQEWPEYEGHVKQAFDSIDLTRSQQVKLEISKDCLKRYHTYIQGRSAL